MSARELGLAILAAHQSPELPEMAMAQLKDADPHVRMLGLQYLKRANQPTVHAVARLLELNSSVSSQTTL